MSSESNNAAPRIDLEQFRPAVMAYRYKAACETSVSRESFGEKFIEEAHERVAEANRLLSVIDDSSKGCIDDANRLDWLEQFVRKAWIYGASFDFAKAFDGEGGGYRFMARHRLDGRQPTLRKAIDAAMLVVSARAKS